MSAPQWFTWAVDQRPQMLELDVEGAPIVYRAWGEPGAPVTILIHGGAAHSGWWDHVGPHLAVEQRIVALDLSGHGDSGHRDGYTLEQWAREVMAVAAAETADRPIVFGHSMGGFVALTAARDHDSRLRGVAAIDSPVRAISAESRAWRDDRAQGALPIYPDAQTMVERFRTLPDDGEGLPYVMRHIARGSVRPVEGGWSWKFDPRSQLRAEMLPDDVVASSCPVALIRGERGMATSDITADVRARLGGRAPVTVIPDGGHHLMIDQPVALIAVLQTLIGQWRTL